MLADIDHIEIIARGTGVRARHYLNRRYGRGNWRKLKGFALVEYETGEVCLAELHWFEAQGIGRKDMKAIRDIEKLP
ncbi:MAG: hypothetical protein DCC55_23160 [Chloroflexi bacterium]|nr:MAG: hypothetical protein DCC55_23160 [Chloroflexota bacterium]